MVGEYISFSLIRYMYMCILAYIHLSFVSKQILFSSFSGILHIVVDILSQEIDAKLVVCICNIMHCVYI